MGKSDDAKMGARGGRVRHLVCGSPGDMISLQVSDIRRAATRRRGGTF